VTGSIACTQADIVRCKSAWLSKAGEDCGVQKLNQDCALACGAFLGSQEALFGVFDGHGPNGEACCSRACTLQV
jgi:serine/threonine protein phosphatase PrpC